MVPAAADLPLGGCRLPGPLLRSDRAAEPVELRSPGGYRDPGPHLQQDLQPGFEGRLWDLTRGTHRSDLVPERQSRLRLGQLQSTPAGTDPRRWELPDACGAAHRDVSPEVRDLPVGLGGVARPDGFGGSLDSSRGGVVRLDD